MEDAELRKKLKNIADQIRDIDLQNMKYLCSDKVEAGQLEHAKSAIDLFVLLTNRDLISPSNLDFLLDLLARCDRKDLAGRLRSSGGDEVTESAPSTVGGSFVDSRKYRVFLNQLCDEITSLDLESLKFLINVPAAIGQTLQSGRDLFAFLERTGQIGPSRITLLSENFDSIHRKDLAKKVREFSRGETLEPQTSRRTDANLIANRKKPVSHSEPVKAIPKHPLLTPQHFMHPVITFPLPTVPIPAGPGPRYPVQCGDDMPLLDEIDEMPAYPMHKRPRGIVLILSNGKFTGNLELGERKGTEKDETNLKEMWRKLSFEVVLETNKTAQEMYTIARQYSSIDHSGYDCFVCCLMSHGVQGSLYGSDSELIEIGQITSQFKGTACPSLANKPKLFFIQACRGRDFDAGVQTDAVRNSEEDAVRHSAEPNEGHFLLGYATPPGYVSWRSMEHGSWYISKLCGVFSTYCERYDVTSMMVKVNDEVSDAYTKKGYKQCPAPVVTLRKRIYFNNN